MPKKANISGKDVSKESCKCAKDLSKECDFDFTHSCVSFDTPHSIQFQNTSLLIYLLRWDVPKETYEYVLERRERCHMWCHSDMSSIRHVTHERMSHSTHELYERTHVTYEHVTYWYVVENGYGVMCGVINDMWHVIYESRHARTSWTRICHTRISWTRIFYKSYMSHVTHELYENTDVTYEYVVDRRV